MLLLYICIRAVYICTGLVTSYLDSVKDGDTPDCGLSWRSNLGGFACLRSYYCIKMHNICSVQPSEYPDVTLLAMAWQFFQPEAENWTSI
ncbi:MAG: hypothetical protein MJA29_00525 [Candidatus Omnitrophica bacterium]|nr:hypothetical protein [Candidatus Omnitrophota bacterium]